MNNRQLFKAAFIAECINRGITTPAGIEKAAQDATSALTKQANPVTTAASMGSRALNSFASSVAPLALAAPPILGGLAGLALGKVNDIDEVDVEQAKKEELIEELRRQTDRVKSRHSALRYEKTLK